MKRKRFHLRSGSISEFIYAADQFEAYDTLKDRSAYDFGLIVEAEPDENDDPILVRTSQLMFRWRRDDEAKLFVQRAIQEGMPDTTEADLKACGR